jgi:hypothetical protein
VCDNYNSRGKAKKGYDIPKKRKEERRRRSYIIPQPLPKNIEYQRVALAASRY